MTPNTGDMVLTHTVRPSLFNRLTEIVTHDPTHHVQTIMGQGPNCNHFSNEAPYMQVHSHLRMVADAEAGIRVFAVYRWHEWVDMPDDYPAYREYRATVRGALWTAADLKVPYDWIGPVILAWDALRKFLPFLRNSTWFPHADRKYFCVEGLHKYQLAAGVDIFATLPPQPYYAPVHVARLVRAGLLKRVEDHGGMHALIMGA
jgi:hypothetical protein